MKPVVTTPVILVLLVLACVTGGWDTRFGAAALAGVLCAAALAMGATPAGRARIFAGPAPWRAGVLMVIVLLWSVAQATPGLSPPHPAWAEHGQFGPTSLHPHATRAETVKLIGLMAAFIIGLAAGRDRASIHRCARVALAALSAYAVVSMALFALSVALGEASPRLYGGLGSANAAAVVFGAGTILATAGLLRAAAMVDLGALNPFHAMDALVRAAPMTTAAFVLCTAALLLTASRAGVAFTAVALAGLAFAEVLPRWRGGWRWPRRRSPAWAVLAAAAGVFLLMSGPVAARLARSPLWEDPRGQLLRAHAEAAGDALMFGHGMGSFGIINNVIMTVENTAALAPVGAAHSAYLQWFEEAGLLGAAPFFAALALLILAPLRAAWRLSRPQSLRLNRDGGPRRRPGVPSHWARAGAAMIGLFALHASVDYALNIYAIACLASLWLGVLWAGAHMPSTARTKPTALLAQPSV